MDVVYRITTNYADSIRISELTEKVLIDLTKKPYLSLRSKTMQPMLDKKPVNMVGDVPKRELY
jgi:hypothetical protein